MFGTVAVSLRTSAGDTCEVPLKGTSVTLSSVRPKACRVAAMLRSIGTDSRSLAFGRHHELLQHLRPGRADQHAGQHQQHGGDRRQLQVAPEHRDEERGRADDRDEQQDQLGRHHRVEVGVGGAGEDVAAVGVQQLVPVEVVRHRLEQHEQPGQHGQLGPGRGRDLPGAAGEPDAAEDVVGDQRDHEADRDRDEQPVQHVPVERQLEGVEADVDAELGVGDAERRGVQELLDGLPVALRREARRSSR